MATFDLMNDPNLLPELQLGFMAMRRTDVIKYAEKYESSIGVIDKRLPKASLVAMLEGFVMAEKIPHPYQPAKNVAEQLREDMATKDQKIEDLQRQISELAAAMKGGNVSPLDMEWNQLQKHAKSEGLEVVGKKRDDLLKDLGFGPDATASAE